MHDETVKGSDPVPDSYIKRKNFDRNR